MYQTENNFKILIFTIISQNKTTGKQINMQHRTGESLPVSKEEPVNQAESAVSQWHAPRMEWSDSTVRYE